MNEWLQSLQLLRASHIRVIADDGAPLLFARQIIDLLLMLHQLLYAIYFYTKFSDTIT